MRKKALDLQKLKPNWEMAEWHGKATKPGLEPKEVKLNSLLLCPCCLALIDKEPVRLCENSKQLFFLGYGFPLFYNSLQFCLASLFILILIESGFLMYLSITSTECDSTAVSRLLAAGAVPYRCIGFFVGISRVSSEITFQEHLARIFSFVAQLLLLLYFRDNQRKLAGYHVERNIRITDFSVIMKNLPKIKGIKKSIREFFDNEFSEIRPSIQEIILIPAIDEYYEKEREKEKMIEKKKEALSANNENILQKIDKEIGYINDEIINLCREINEKSEKDELHAQKAIILFKTEDEKVKVLNKFPTLSLPNLENYFIWMAKEIKIEQAPDPKEIIWKNINYPQNERWVKVLIGWVLTTLFLGAVTGIFYSAIRSKGERLDENLHGEDGYTSAEYQQAVAIVFITITLIQFFNKFLMKIFLQKIADMEMPETTAELQFSYALKYTLGMFFTTAVMTLAVEALQFDNYDGEYGVVEEETIMFFFNAYFVPLLWITHPQYYIKKLVRRWKKGTDLYTQKEANELMEEVPYDIGKRYAQIIQTMWFTFLYSSLIPLGSMLTFSGLVVYYWVDKYNLVRRSSLSGTIESKLPLNAIKLLEITIFWKTFGELLFDLQLRSVHVSTIVMLVVSVLYLVFPWNRILDAFFEEKFNVKTVTYEEAKYRFNEIYETVDPIRRQLALEKFLKSRNKRNKTALMVADGNQAILDKPIQQSVLEINLVTNNINLAQESLYSNSDFKMEK